MDNITKRLEETSLLYNKYVIAREEARLVHNELVRKGVEHENLFDYPEYISAIRVEYDAFEKWNKTRDEM